MNGLYKAECVRHEGPVSTVDDLELRTLTWGHYRQITPAQQPPPGELALH